MHGSGKYIHKDHEIQYRAKINQQMKRTRDKSRIKMSKKRHNLNGKVEKTVCRKQCRCRPKGEQGKQEWEGRESRKGGEQESGRAGKGEGRPRR